MEVNRINDDDDYYLGAVTLATQTKMYGDGVHWHHTLSRPYKMGGAGLPVHCAYVVKRYTTTNLMVSKCCQSLRRLSLFIRYEIITKKNIRLLAMMMATKSYLSCFTTPWTKKKKCTVHALMHLLQPEPTETQIAE
jgi:hypothetical protein